MGAPVMHPYGSQQRADNMLPHTYRPEPSQAWGMPEHRIATAEHGPPRPFIHPAAFQAPLSPPAFSQQVPQHQLPFPTHAAPGNACTSALHLLQARPLPLTVRTPFNRQLKFAAFSLPTAMLS